VLVVVILIACAFGAGALLGFLQLRGARGSWQKEKAELEARLAQASGEIGSLHSRESLWRIAEATAAARIDLAEKNFGLARDAAAAARETYIQAAAALDANTRNEIAPLEPLLAELEKAADAVSPDAKIRAREAAELLQKLLESTAPGPGTTATPPPSSPAPGTGSP
jgi:hypothetical protein